MASASPLSKSGRGGGAVGEVLLWVVKRMFSVDGVKRYVVACGVMLHSNVRIP